MGTCAGVSTCATQPPAPLGEHTAPRGAPHAPCSLLGCGSEHPAAPRGSAPLGDGVLTGVPRPGLGVSPAAVGLRGAEAGVALGAVPDKGGEEDDGEELEEEAQPGQTEPRRGSSTLSHTGGGGQQTPNRAGGSLQTPPVGPPAPARTPEGSRQTRARRGAGGCCWQRKMGGGVPSRGGVPSLPVQLEGEGFVCFALLRSAFRWLLPPGRVCCAPGAQTPKRKRKRKEPKERASPLGNGCGGSRPCQAGTLGTRSRVGDPARGTIQGWGCGRGGTAGRCCWDTAGTDTAPSWCRGSGKQQPAPNLSQALLGGDLGSVLAATHTAQSPQQPGEERAGLTPLIFPFFALFRPPPAHKNHRMV